MERTKMEGKKMEVTNRQMEATLEVLKRFKDTNPWQGTVGERVSKFKLVFVRLRKIYNRSNLKLYVYLDTSIRNWHGSGSSSYSIKDEIILLEGRLSVITFLHEFAHALFGRDEIVAQNWSTSWFKRIWSDKFEKLKLKGRMFVKEK